MTPDGPMARTLARMTGILTVRPLPARSKAFDLLFAGVLCMSFGLFSVAQKGFAGIIVFGMLVPLVWRRTRPELVFFVVSAVAVLQWLTGQEVRELTVESAGLDLVYKHYHGFEGDDQGTG